MESESTFVAPEGVYSLTEEHKPQILQLVSSAPSPYQTRISTVTIKYAHKPGGQGLSGLLGRQDKSKEKDKPDADRVSVSSSDNANDDAAGSNGSSADVQKSLPFTGPSLFSQPVQPLGGKRKNQPRPRHNMKTTSSAFVTRHQTAEGLNRTLAAKQGDITYIFFNHGKSIFWAEAGVRAKDPLARITFSAYPTCHDVNHETVGPDRLDVIIGFSTGDLVWFDAISSRYVRLNKQGSITSSPCTSVRWVPRSPSLFVVSHADGTILVYDKEREDGSFTPTDPDAPIAAPLAKEASSHSNHSNGNNHNLEPGTGASSQTSSILPSSSAASDPQQWDPLDDVLVSKPPWHPAVMATTAERDSRKIIVKNPLSHWRVSRRGVLGFVFSPDVQHIAVVSDDGCLRIIDALHERLLDIYSSYFGALTSVDWSPDGRFILTGGQDDLVTVVSPWDQRIVARCQGHSSFISSVAFDHSRCDGRTYRFGSVGEDSRLILWDFSSGALHRPKMSLSHHQRMSLSSTLSLVRRHPIGADPSLLQLQLPNGEAGTGRKFHPAPARSEVAIVQPVLVKQVEGEIMTSVAFLPTSVLTANKAGLVKVWIRPLAVNKPLRTPRQR